MPGLTSTPDSLPPFRPFTTQPTWLGSLDLHPAAQLRLELAVEEFAALDARIRRIEKELADVRGRASGGEGAHDDPGCGASAPPETFVAWADDVTRFRNNRQIGSYE